MNCPSFYRGAMVVKIYAPAPSVSSGLNYNERKVAEGKASVISSQKIDDLRNPMATFQRYENGSLRTKNMSFHASVNPSITDKMSEDQVREFVGEYMEKMGYGNQPYILYKHTDTGRDHYHIVSVRVDENGRKIPDFRERVRSLEVLKELGLKYGFEVGRGKDLGEEVEPGEGKPKETNPYLGFNPEAGDFGNQIERIADLAMTYHFTEARHFEVIMESLGVKVGYQEKGISDSMYFIGLDPKTHKHCTAPISSAGIRYPDANTIDAHVKECKGKIKTREKQRLVNITHAALKDCMSELHFLRWMAKSGVYVAFSKTEKGKIYAVTFIDHHTKCCFKTADLNGITPKLFEEARLHVWKDTPREQKSVHEEISQAIAGSLLSGLGNESSRRHEDEKLMRQGEIEID